jgi:hypothetical protein
MQVMIRLWSCFHLLLDKANLQNTNSAIREVTSQQERITIMMQAPAPYQSALCVGCGLPAAAPVRACACVLVCDLEKTREICASRSSR